MVMERKEHSFSIATLDGSRSLPMKVIEDGNFTNQGCYHSVKKIPDLVAGPNEVVDKIMIIIVNDEEILADKHTCLERILKHYPNALTVFSVPKDANKRPSFKILDEMAGEVAKKAKSFPADLATEAGI